MTIMVGRGLKRMDENDKLTAKMSYRMMILIWKTTLVRMILNLPKMP
jgi:hypothetical protein